MKLYLEHRPAPRLYLALTESASVEKSGGLYLDVQKAKKTPQKQNITLAQRGGGGQTQEGYVLGNYAYHKVNDARIRGEWIITHVPSGMQFAQVDTKKVADDMVRFLHEAAPNVMSDATLGDVDIKSDDAKKLLDAKNVFQYGKERPSSDEMKAVYFNGGPGRAPGVKEARKEWLAQKKGKKDSGGGGGGGGGGADRASPKEVAAALNKLPFTDLDEKDFLTLAEEIRDKFGVAADTKNIGDAFDQGLVNGIEELRESSKQSQGPVKTGPRGGRYIETAGGGKKYLGKSEGPALFLKANPHRDPTIGQFIAGGAGKGMSGHGQHDLEEEVNSMMDVMPGQDLEKDS